MPDKPYPSEWLRGVLEVAVLRILRDGPTYGYAISVGLEQAGFGALKGGTLYPLLGRLDGAGLVSTDWRPGESGPGRKYYSLTDAGRASLTESAAQWVDFAQRVTDFVTGPTTATTTTATTTTATTTTRPARQTRSTS